MNTTDRLLLDLDEAEKKAWDALSRYKFQMFDYWAAIWVHLNRIANANRPNPWTGLVQQRDARALTNGRWNFQKRQRRIEAMRFGSVFSGIGGFDLGLERVGMTCAWQSESDPACIALLNRKFNVLLIPDCHHVTAATAQPVDLICGGFPCQDVSIAGKRTGLAGKQSGLWFQFHRILAEFKPQWVLVENVPGLLSSHGGQDFAVLLHGLVELGYGVAWRILDAQYFGIPQRRRRVFIVGHLGDGRAAEILFESESVSRDSQARQAPQSAIATGIADSISDGGQRISNTLGSHHGRNDLDSMGAYITAYNWQSGGDVQHSFGLPNLSANQTPAVGVRRLTPLECERLQGFPDGWTAGQPDSVRYRQLGNAVAVPVVEWIGQRILRP